MNKGSQCLVLIKGGLFLLTSNLRQNTAKYIFSNPIDSFEIYSPNESKFPSFWAITGPAKTPFLKTVAGQYIATPPLARTYPYFLEHNLNYNDRILFLNFSESSGLDKVYLSARYESFSYKGALEMSDDVNSVQNYITGANNYNSNTAVDIKNDKAADEYVSELLKLFDLEHLKEKWINSLSNGQLRRARIAKSLMKKPDLLIIDDPFLGLDPAATVRVSDSISKVVTQFGIGVVLGLRVQDKIPNWISHIGYVDSDGLEIAADRDSEILKPIYKEEIVSDRNKESTPITNVQLKQNGDIHIEFNKASVVYKSVPVLQDFSWVVPRGSKWRILGNNGTGKTTLLSLITADHPQSWKSVLAIDGKVRKTGSGTTFFDINNKVGISSPELHALVPPQKTMMQVIMTGLSKDVGNSNFMFVAKEDKLTPFAVKLLDQFSDRIEKSKDTPFYDLLLTDQKLTLFLRATIKKPEILILDEAFSCMDDVDVMHRCHALVSTWKEMTVLSIGHIDWELPECEYVLKLRGSGKPYDIEKYV